jgi:beta-galactosidase/beta-glucuronidase
MKKLLVFLLVVASCTSQKTEIRENVSLAGEWKFKIDSLDQGVGQKWYNKELDETVMLPGSMAENGKGNEVSLNTDWTGDIVDKSYFTEIRYEKYRRPGNIKIPFWLKPVKYYKGAAWYQKDVEIPDAWNGKRVVLFLERCHWESTVYVNETKTGSQNGLSTPHEYDLTNLLVQGKNRISIRIDNRVIIPIGINSHSISDHTQSNWNGITGEIYLTATAKVYIDEIKVFPDLQNKTAKVIVSIKNPENIDFKGKLGLQAQNFNSLKDRKLSRENVTIVTKSGEQQVILDYKIPDPQLWSEFAPSLYKMSASLTAKGKIISPLILECANSTPMGPGLK